jgi:hypothetical protein
MAETVQIGILATLARGQEGQFACHPSVQGRIPGQSASRPNFPFELGAAFLLCCHFYG